MMLNETQARLAVTLLREALDWIGIVDLTPEQEEHAEAVQQRIETLLMECGAMPGRIDVSRQDETKMLYRTVLYTREKLRQALQERDHSRRLLHEALKADNSEAAVLAVRRLNLAYAEAEAAEWEVARAEAAFQRSFRGVAGGIEIKCA